MQQLLHLLTELENKIPSHDKINTKVSAANVGWHIQHTTLATVRIVDAIKQTDPSTYKSKFNWKRTLIYTLNKLPRGKVKAPKSVQPTEEITPEGLRSGIQKAKNRVTELSALQPKQYLAHPYFGNLDLKRSIRFLNLHTKHHLKIIDEILNN